MARPLRILILRNSAARAKARAPMPKPIAFEKRVRFVIIFAIILVAIPLVSLPICSSIPESGLKTYFLLRPLNSPLQAEPARLLPTKGWPCEESAHDQH